MKAVVYSKNGTAKYEARNVEYHDAWMGEEYVTFSLESPYPINIEIGDYLVYRGHTYSAYNVPSALKQARRNSYGAAFKYDNVKFSSRSAEMADTDMHDIVLYDNNIHYTSLPKFSVYCETFDDLLDRLQANMNRNGGWQWIFLSPNFQRVSQRYPLDNPLREEAIRLWEQYYGSDHDNPTADLSKEKRGVNISFDNNSVWDALGKVHEVFGVNYLCYDRVVVVGTGGVPADKIFRYGKGNGLATIERIADNDQKVVTRLFAYGSNKNLPLRYYSDLAWKPFMTVTYKEDMSEYDDPIYFRVQLDMPWAIGTYKEPHPSWHNATLQQDLIGGWAPVVASLDMKTPIAYTNPYSGERKSILSCDMVEHNLYQQFVKGQARLNGLPMELYDTIEVGTRIYFLDGVYRESFNDQHRGYDLAELPNNMAVDFLMLPGFPKYSLSELCRCVEENGKTLYQIRKDTDTENYNTFLEVDGSHPITFSTDKLKPYIQSQNAATLGIKEGNIFFDEENDDNGLKEVYPSIEEMTVGDVFGTQSTERLDELADAQIVEDNGVFEEGKEVSNVWVALKDLGFNLQWAINNSTGDAQINFKDGYCSGRTFSIKGVSQNEDGTWKVSLQREVDNSVHLYFPYSSAAARGGDPSSDEAYQLQAGDHFVLTGISLSDTSYVWAASVRALRKAIVWLLANDYTRFTYRPAVDEIFMQRQHDAAMSGEETVEYGSVSLHDTLKAGMLMLFEDEDLNVDGSLFIDSLTIKEEGNNGIPTYDVVLREEKQVGTLQKMQNEVNSVSTSVMSGAGGLSIPQVEGLIKTYGKEWFLSRVADDVAQGFIGFVKGLWVKTKGLFGIDENGDAKVHSLTVNEDYSIDEDGDAILHDVNANNVVTKTLTAQEAHFFNLVIDEVKSVGGQMIVSPANAQIGKVIFYDKDGNEVDEDDTETPITAYYLWIKKEDDKGNAITMQFESGDLILHMEFNVAQAQTRNYWMRVEAALDNNYTMDFDGVTRPAYLLLITPTSDQVKAGSARPRKGDHIAVFGNRSNAARQNAIVISAYNIPFIDSEPYNGDSNGIQAPLFVEYTGVGSWTKSEDKFKVKDANRKNVIARNGTRLRGDFQVWNGSSSSYSSITAIIQALSDSITMRVSSVENTVANGMKNLILNSDFTLWDGDIPVMFASVNNTQPGSTTFEKITSNLPVGFQTGVIVSCLHGYDGIAIGTWSSPKQPYFPIEAGKSYTFSFWVKTQSSSNIYIEADKVYSTIPTSTTWERKSLTFTAKDDHSENNRITILCQSIDTMYLTGLQLEEGGNMTAWKPAVEDTNANIASQVDIKADEINGTITNLNNGLEIAGVHVDATTPNNSEIRLRANKVKIQTYTEDSDATDTLFTTVEEEVEEGGQKVTKHRAMVKTDYVQATEVVTNGLQAQTIDAQNATIENLNVKHAEIEESVFKGDIYTPPFILDEDNIGEMDEEDPSKYKYLTKISKIVYYYEAGNRTPKSKTITVYAVKVGVIGYNVQQIAYYFMKEGGTVDVDYVVINEPSTTSEKEALCGVECNYVYTPRTNHNINMVVLIWNEEAVAYQNTEITLQPMSAVKCKYTKYRKPTDGTFDYGWVLVSHSNCLIPFNQQANILTIDGCLVHKGGIVNNVRRTQSMTIRLTTEDSFLFTTGKYNKTIYLPDNPATGQTIHIRICGSHSIHVYPATSTSYGHKISNNGVNKLDDWSTNDGGICIFVWDGVDSWQLARMENTGT